MKKKDQQQSQLTQIKIPKFSYKNSSSACTMILYVLYLVMTFLTCLSISALVYTMWLYDLTGIQNQSIALLNLCSQNYLNIKFDTITSSTSLIYQYLFIVFISTCSSAFFTIFNTLFSIINLIRFMLTSQRQKQKYKNQSKQQNNQNNSNNQPNKQKVIVQDTKQQQKQNQKSKSVYQTQQRNWKPLRGKNQQQQYQLNSQDKKQISILNKLQQKQDQNKQNKKEQNQFHLVTLNKLVFHSLINSFSLLLSIIMIGRILALYVQVINSSYCSVSYNSSQFTTIKILALIVFSGQIASYTISIIQACLFKHSIKQFEQKIKTTLKSLKKVKKNINQNASQQEVNEQNKQEISKNIQNIAPNQYFGNSQRRELLLDKSKNQIDDNIQLQIYDSPKNNSSLHKNYKQYNNHAQYNRTFYNQEYPLSIKKRKEQLLRIEQEQEQLSVRFKEQQKRYITQMTAAIEKNRQNQNNLYKYYNNQNINTQKPHFYRSIGFANNEQDQKREHNRPYSPYQVQKINQNLYIKNNTNNFHYSIDKELFGLSNQNQKLKSMSPEMSFKKKLTQNYFSKNENNRKKLYQLQNKNERLRSNIKYSQNFFDQFESKRVTKQKSRYQYQI